MLKHIFWPYNKYLRAEFLPGRISYLWVYVYAFWKSLFARSVLRYTATNPWFPLGWLYPSSKDDVLKMLPQAYVPKTIFIWPEMFNEPAIHTLLDESALNFPLIIKPDNGVRWLGIRIFHTQQEFDDNLLNYIKNNEQRGSRLLQEFIDYPLELGVFVVRLPHQEWKITWIVEKEFLSIIGDGVKTFESLVHEHSRAKYHIALLKEEFAPRRNTVIPEWEEVDIVEIWTHSRWSTFLDRSELVSPAMTSIFAELSSLLPGFYYGRFDIRAKSLEWLEHGEFKIMEVNPTYGEPTWMYDPSYNYIQQQRILLDHRRMMYDVARYNHTQGYPYATLQEFIKAKRKYQKTMF